MKDDVLDKPRFPDRRYFWTPERVGQLRTMLTYQDMSCIEMARALGVTKNAIVGKTNRMGLSVPRPDPAVGDAVRRARLDRRNECARLRAAGRKEDPKPPRPLWKPRRVRAEPAQAVTGEPVDIVGLTAKTCRWPLWEDRGASGDKMYCGAAVVVGSRYCSIHFEMARPKGGR